MTSRRILMLLLAVHVGCASSRGLRLTSSESSQAGNKAIRLAESSVDESEPRTEEAGSLQLTTYQAESPDNADDPQATKSPTGSETTPSAVIDSAVPSLATEVSLEDVIRSVHRSYPLVHAAFQERAIADGNQLSSWGEFDTKLKAASENGPLGFYETYRNSAGFTNPIYGGGEFFGGYRNGGGDFQPWYQERETNDGGEFKAGVRVPLLRNREIDARRAALWRATYDQQIADPVIQSALVQFSREAGLAYWKWVAAGQKYKVGQQWLELARSRNDKIKLRVEAQDLDPPELIDNERAIAKREAKLADSLRILQQAAIKLSLFLRDENGQPIILGVEDLPDFPRLRLVDEARLSADVAQAQQARPELRALDLKLKQLQVDYAEAHNFTRPALDAQLVGSQDMGQPTSKKRDKSEFEVEAALFFDVPLQRRKGLGKMHAVQAKMSQVAAKRLMVKDKVAAQVRLAYAGLIQSRQEVLKAREAVSLASQMADFERLLFESGQSDLLKVALREQYALEAAEDLITATLTHFIAFTEFAATLAIDRPSPELLPASPNED